MEKHRSPLIEKWVLVFVSAVNILAIYTALVVAPPEEHLGESYSIFYVHVPSAWVGYLAFGVALISSILFLIKRKKSFDALAYSAIYIGLVYVAAALITGSIWAKVAWGEYWNWDPRQTATLVLWLGCIVFLFVWGS